MSKTSTLAVAVETVAVAVAPVIKLKGKGKAKRELAYMQVSTFALFDAQSREEMLGNLVLAFGAAPSKDEILAAREQHVIGRLSRVVPGDDDSARIEKAGEVYRTYAPADRTRPLEKHHTGKRTIEQERAIVASRKHFSDACAEIVADPATPATLREALLSNGYGKAMTQKEQNDKKKGGKAGKVTTPAPTAPTGQQLVEGAPAAALDAQGAVDHVCRITAGLLAWSKGKSGAAVLPMAFGQFIARMNDEACKLAGQFAEERAKADAIAADAEDAKPVTARAARKRSK